MATDKKTDFVTCWEGSGSRQKQRFLSAAEYMAHPLKGDRDFEDTIRIVDWLEFLSALHCESQGRIAQGCLCRMVNASPDGIKFPDEWRFLAPGYAEKRADRGQETMIHPIRGERNLATLYPVRADRLYFAIIDRNVAGWDYSDDRIEYRWVNKKQAIKLGLDDPNGLNRGRNEAHIRKVHPVRGLL